MKFQISKNSLFAVLLRSQWWISFAIAAGIVALVKAILPAIPVSYAVFAALPFIVIGAIAAWKQLRAPSATRSPRRSRRSTRCRGEISPARWRTPSRDGYRVNRVAGGAADFEMTKAGRTSLVACKRWKVARTGVDPLRDLHAAKDAREANECVYIAAGEITDGARKFALEKKIRLVDGAELARLLPRAGRAA